MLPRDAHLFGVEPERLELAWAVRMSMSIPVFFEPVSWSHATSGQDHVIVDGGMLSNFPVWLFDCEGEPRRPTFGLMLAEPDPREEVGERIVAAETSGGPIRGLITYLTSLISTMLEANDRRYVEQADYARTIPIPTLGVGTTEFDLGPGRAEDLYRSGRAATERFLDEVWDFEGYKAHFRRGASVSRRRQLAETMRGG